MIFGGRAMTCKLRWGCRMFSVKYAHVIAHAIGNQADQLEFMGAVMDITATKQAEEKLHNAQAELPHITRLTTLGELTASIAHEVNQPLAAVVANAEACLGWLDRETPDLNAARRSVDWLIEDGNRASEVVRRVRALANKTDTQKVPLDINNVVREVVTLVQRELIGHRISLPTELAPAPPKILGDRGPTAAGDYQLDDEWNRSNAAGDGSPARTGHPTRPGRDIPSARECDGLRRRVFRR